MVSRQPPNPQDVVGQANREPARRRLLREDLPHVGLVVLTTVAEQMRRACGGREHPGHDVIGGLFDGSLIGHDHRLGRQEARLLEYSVLTARRGVADAAPGPPITAQVPAAQLVEGVVGRGRKAAKVTARKVPRAAGRSSARLRTQAALPTPSLAAEREACTSISASGSRPTTRSNSAASRRVTVPGPQPTWRARPLGEPVHARPHPEVVSPRPSHRAATLRSGAFRGCPQHPGPVLEGSCGICSPARPPTASTGSSTA
jgi:hypothetical protein